MVVHGYEFLNDEIFGKLFAQLKIEKNLSLTQSTKNWLKIKALQLTIACKQFPIKFPPKTKMIEQFYRSNIRKKWFCDGKKNYDTQSEYPQAVYQCYLLSQLYQGWSKSKAKNAYLSIKKHLSRYLKREGLLVISNLNAETFCCASRFYGFLQNEFLNETLFVSDVKFLFSVWKED